MASSGEGGEYEPLDSAIVSESHDVEIGGDGVEVSTVESEGGCVGGA